MKTKHSICTVGEYGNKLVFNWCKNHIDIGMVILTSHINRNNGAIILCKLKEELSVIYDDLPCVMNSNLN